MTGGFGALRLATLALVALLLGPGQVSAQPAVAEVWPSTAKRHADGRVEYGYDLSSVKARKVTLEVSPDADEAKLAAFLKALPARAQVVVNPRRAKVRLHAAGELESAPLSSSFARSSDGTFVQGGIGAAARAKGVPAYHPDAPHPLVSADLLLWYHGRTEDSVLAALHLGLHRGTADAPLGREAFLNRLVAKAHERSVDLQGDAKDGALLLVARLGGALEATGARGSRPWRGDAALSEAVAAEAAALTRPAPRFPVAPWRQWSSALGALTPVDRALQWPFDRTREGAACVLTFLVLLEEDPELGRAYAAHRALRDALFGAPEHEPLDAYRKALGDGGAKKALDDMSSFLARLPRELAEAKHTPPLFAAPSTPFTRFLARLEGPEQLYGVEELTVAVQDARVGFDAPAGWPSAREAFARALLTAGSADAPEATSDYRARLARTFGAQLGAHAEVTGGETWTQGMATADSAPDGEGTPFRVRLMTPPHLEVEPLPDLYAALGASWARLSQTLKDFPKAAKLRGLGPDGRPRPQTLAQEASRMQARFRGLELVARASLGEVPAAAPVDARALREARSWLGRWRTQPELRQDARHLLPVGEAVDPGTFQHAGVLGIGRREVEARFALPPEVKVLSAADAGVFVTGVNAPQRYQAQVLATGAVTVPRAEPLAPQQLRQLADREETRDAIEAALPGALVRTLRPVDDAP